VQGEQGPIGPVGADGPQGVEGKKCLFLLVLVYENIFGYIQEIKAILDRKEFKARLDYM